MLFDQSSVIIWPTAWVTMQNNKLGAWGWPIVALEAANCSLCKYEIVTHCFLQVSLPVLWYCQVSFPPSNASGISQIAQGSHGCLHFCNKPSFKMGRGRTQCRAKYGLHQRLRVLNPHGLLPKAVPCWVSLLYEFTFWAEQRCCELFHRRYLSGPLSLRCQCRYCSHLPHQWQLPR